ncbi:uncharacterized protein LOC110038978 [Phalaenopsis equestris]|uniref:uncharacterized protein LOC110038978 n=1 Tax=Phalaenopsis equestris TaxID=78828 RepID=UPI0009E371D1|nr:uncharacterized protein LOC110038978 [Phalaenopsis equestris]
MEEEGSEKNGKCDAREEESEWIEFDAEFKPMEHPLEPLEEDQPLQCPIPDSSFLNQEKYELKQRRLVDELLKSKEPSEEDEESILPLQAEPKRHHKIHQHSSIQPQPPFWGSHYNIFQVFQQCKDFSS